jgi:hypothetical protein
VGRSTPSLRFPGLRNTGARRGSSRRCPRARRWQASPESTARQRPRRDEHLQVQIGGSIPPIPNSRSLAVRKPIPSPTPEGERADVERRGRAQLKRREGSHADRVQPTFDKSGPGTLEILHDKNTRAVSHWCALQSRKGLPSSSARLSDSAVATLAVPPRLSNFRVIGHNESI